MVCVAILNIMAAAGFNDPLRVSSVGRRRAAFNAQIRRPLPQASSNGRPRIVKCFNCGENHLLPACPHPPDPIKIAANRRKFEEAKA